MTDETTNETAAGAPANPNAVPAHIIPAALPHPQLSSPLARGIQYLHHFEIALVSDGTRLWDAASAEGKQLIADIKGEKSAQADTIAAAKAAPPAAAQELDPEGKPATGGTPQPAA